MLHVPAIIRYRPHIYITTMTDFTEEKETSSLDKKIEFAERRVLMYQARLITIKERANLEIKNLEREEKALEEIKKEWIRKRSLEEERARVELNDLKKVHRHAIEDLRIKYEKDRENKLRELKMLIREEEKEIKEWQQKRAEAAMITRTKEAEIKSRFQVQIQSLLKDRESTARRGVVRQKRLLDTPNVFSMSLERNHSIGMKKRSYTRKM